MSYIREIETLKNICAWHGFSTYCEIATIIVEFSMSWEKKAFSFKASISAKPLFNLKHRAKCILI